MLSIDTTCVNIWSICSAACDAEAVDYWESPKSYQDNSKKKQRNRQMSGFFLL